MPDPDNEGPITGQDVIYEDLRPICILKETEGDDDYDTWFEY